EPHLLQYARAADVPRVRHDEAASGMEPMETGDAIRLCVHATPRSRRGTTLRGPDTGADPTPGRTCQRAGHREVTGPLTTLDQLQPLVLPQPSQTKQDPAGRIFVPQVKHSGESTAVPVICSSSSAEVWASAGAGLAAASTGSTGSAGEDDSTGCFASVGADRSDS